ncbi:uncharacterized protein [Brachyistius frenatus]|uniref:uncharacterized protein n=1 Tax=Brachyistius frenatus TaxID=100188 RepID=UPI0037E8780A
MESTIRGTDEILQSLYEDPDAFLTNENTEYPADYKTPRPVRPPPEPPESKPATPRPAVKPQTYKRTNANSTVTSPALCTKEKPPPPPPPVKPKLHPASPFYYGRPPSAMSLRYECFSEASSQSKCSSISPVQQTPVSPALSQEALKLLRSSDGAQIRPPRPSFIPPQPPSLYSTSVYSEIDRNYYLNVVPGETDEMDISELLRWLKRMSMSDFMDLPVYDLSIQVRIRSFEQRAMNLKKVMRLYNLLMMKRKENLQNMIKQFQSICALLEKMQKKTKKIGIAGGTTGAVGGVTAVLGIALAPVTMGASLIATAVGVGIVASAGGIGAHKANANNKVVDRKTVAKLVEDYKTDIGDLERCLDFIFSGMDDLRRHNIARLKMEGVHPDAVRVAQVSYAVLQNIRNNREFVAQTSGVRSGHVLQAFALEMDLYFTKEKLRKSSKCRFLERVSQLAKNLQDHLDHLLHMWEMFS